MSRSAVTAVTGAILAHVFRGTGECVKWIRKHIGDPAPLFSSAKELFGSGREDICFSVGTIHPEWGARGQSANRNARNVVLRPSGVFDVVRRGRHEIDENDAFLVDVSRNIVCLGGPTSNELAQLVFEYEGDHPYRLIRSKTPIFDRWNWSYIVNEEAIAARASAWKADPSGGQYEVSNWGIDECGHSIWPLMEQDLLVSDFLLITRIKNFLDLPAFQRGKHITIVGGAHGVGTVGVALLLRAKGAVDEISRRRSSEEFQVLVELADMAKVRDEYALEARRIVSLEVADLDIPDSMYQEARERMSSRIQQLGLLGSQAIGRGR